MPNTTIYSDHPVGKGRPGVDLKWPASAIWRDGEPEVRKIGLHDLKDAVRLGLEDFRAMPSHAIYLCLIYPIAGLVLFRLAFGYELLPLVYPLIAGFVLLGPVAALGLYELSRQREQGLAPSAWDAARVLQSQSIGAITRLGLVLLALFIAWLAIANLVYTQIFGATAPASLSQFYDQVTTTAAGHQLAVVGNAIGLLFAVIALVISVVAFPMLVDRDVSATTAVRTSIRSVLENPAVMAVWGLFVVAALAAGALPLLMGLAVVLPVLGHATWHLYRKVVAK